MSRVLLDRRNWIGHLHQIEEFEASQNFPSGKRIIQAKAFGIPSYKVVSLNEVLDIANESQEGFVWFDFQSPSETELSALSEAYHFDPITTKDIIPRELVEHSARVQHEQVKIYQDYFFASINESSSESNVIVNNAINCIVFKERGIVFTFHVSESINFSHVLYRIIYDARNERTADWVFCALMDSTTQSLTNMVQQAILEVESLQNLVCVLHSGEHEAMQNRIGARYQSVTGLHKLFWTKRDTINLVLSNHPLHLSSQNVIYLNEILTHVNSTLDQLKSLDVFMHHLSFSFLEKVELELRNKSTASVKSLEDKGMISLIIGLALCAFVSISLYRLK